MPQASDELRKRWDVGDGPVIAYLKAKGFTLLPNYHWRKPSPDHEVTEAEWSAMDFLVEEWDFGGLAP